MIPYEYFLEPVMRLRLCRAILLVMLWSFAWGASRASAADKTGTCTGGPLRIGAIASLTGDAARDGSNWLEGAELAVDDLRDSGKQVEFLIEDDGTVPGKAAAAFVKLARVDEVRGIIGGTWDFLADSVYPLAKEHRVPFITSTNPPELMASSAKTNPWIMTNGLSLAAERKAVRSFMNRTNPAGMGLTYINVPYGTSHAQMLRELAEERGIPVLTDDPVSYEGFADSIRLGALHVTRKKPDLAFIVLNYEGVDLFLRELERLHSHPAVLATHSFRAAFEFAAQPARYANAYGVLQSFKSERFSERFRARFGRDPYGYAAPAYDAVMFLAQIAEHCTELDAPGVSLVYDGITGSHRLPAVNGGVVENTAAILEVRDGKLKEIR